MAEHLALHIVERLGPFGRWVDLRIYGSVEGLAIYARDVTRPRRLSALLDQERARLLEAQAIAHTGSWETDLVTGKVVWSAELHRIFETDAQIIQMTHLAFLDHVHPDDRAKVDAAFMASFNLPTPQSIAPPPRPHG